jgi:hypothetical protein
MLFSLFYSGLAKLIAGTSGRRHFGILSNGPALGLGFWQTQFGLTNETLGSSVVGKLDLE